MARTQLLLVAILALFASSAVAQGLAAARGGNGGNNLCPVAPIEVEVDESSSLRTGLVLRLLNEGGCSVLPSLRSCVGDLLTLRLRAIVREGNVLVGVFAGVNGGNKQELRIPLGLDSLGDLTLTLDLSNINLRIGRCIVQLVGPADAALPLFGAGAGAGGLNLRGGAQPGVGLGITLNEAAQDAIAATLQGLIDLSLALGVNAAIALDIILVLLTILSGLIGLGLDANVNIANLVRVAVKA